MHSPHQQAASVDLFQNTTYLYLFCFAWRDMTVVTVKCVNKAVL